MVFLVNVLALILFSSSYVTAGRSDRNGDGRLCPGSDWRRHGANCYYVSPPTHPLNTWDQAARTCRDLGGPVFQSSLASVLDSEETAFILRQINLSHYPFGHWIGLRKSTKDSPFRWIDGSPVQYTPWVPGEPNGLDGRALCVLMYVEMWRGLWDNDNCSANKGFVCKARADEKPTPTLSPLPIETTRRIHPVPGRCLSGWIDLAGSCFHFGTLSRLSWSGAERVCRQRGGSSAHLTSIANQRENTVLAGYMRNLECSAGCAWIGLTRMASNYSRHIGYGSINDKQHWTWLDGSTPSYTRWDTRQAAHTARNAQCVGLNILSGLWREYHCSTDCCYICRTEKMITKPDGPPTHNPAITVTTGKILPGEASPSPTTWQTSPATPGRCSRGWIGWGDSCFLFGTVPRLHRTGADYMCRKRGGSPASLTSTTNPRLTAVLAGHMQGSNCLAGCAWFGLSWVTSRHDRLTNHARAKRSHSSWRYGSNHSYSGWATTRPAELEQVRKCVGMNISSGVWREYPCSAQCCYICRTTKIVTKPDGPPTPNPVIAVTTERTLPGSPVHRLLEGFRGGVMVGVAASLTVAILGVLLGYLWYDRRRLGKMKRPTNSDQEGLLHDPVK